MDPKGASHDLVIPAGGQGLRSEREVVDEPREIDEPRPPEAEPLDDLVGEVGLDVADDDAISADVNLEADELGSREACDDDEPKAAAGRALQVSR